MPWPASRVVAEWDALQLGVHRAITADSAADQALPELTTYVRRAHDDRLQELLATPVRPVMVVLVGGSSTGKTRAAFEAVRQCLPGWSLLRPVDAADLLGQLTSGAVGPHTVLWLNETQVFLRDQPQAAAGLRRLLAGGEAVAVVGTMWPRFWKEFTAEPASGPDVHYQARELLLHGTVRVEVPEVFADEDLAELYRHSRADGRLETAADAARSDGKVIQVLAGGPALVHRYEYPADAEARYGEALVTAAMDIRRLGHELPIGRTLLDECAVAFLDPADRVDAPGGWLDIGFADATMQVHGIAALTARREQASVGSADGYVLHDYLDQYARTARCGALVPAAVWNALAVRSAAGDRTRLAWQAQRRGLYRLAIALATPAAEAGDTAAMQFLAWRLDEAGHTEDAGRWWRRAVEAGNPTAVQTLAKRLDDAGRGEEAEGLLRQAADAGDTSAILALAARLDQAGHDEKAEQWLRRAVDAGDTVVMERLAARFYEAGRGEEAEQWWRRAADAGDAIVMQILAGRLDEAGRGEEAEQWWRRAAETGGHFARFVMIRLAQRCDEAGRGEEAEQWLLRAIEAGDTSTMWVLAARLEQAGRGEEAEGWRRRAFDAGDYFAVFAAIAQIEQDGGGIEDFDRLLRGPAEAGNDFARMSLVERLVKAGRSEEAENLLRPAAEAGDFAALMRLVVRLDEGGRGDEAEQWLRRALELGYAQAPHVLADRLDKTDPAQAERLRRFGIEPGGVTAAPW